MGNETSGPVTYGTKLLNNISVEWEKVAMNVKLPSRDGHCAAAIENKLYIFGGVRWLCDIGGVSESNEILLFDVATLSLKQLVTEGDIPSARSSAAMAAVGNKLYVFGGLSKDCGWFDDMHTFDIETKQWKRIEFHGAPPSPRDKLTCVTMGTKILFWGGFGPSEEPDIVQGEGAKFKWFNDLFCFDTETHTWKKLFPGLNGCPTPRAAHGMCAVGSKVVIFGGRDSVGRKNDLFLLDTETMEWISTPTTGRQPEPRSFHTCTAVGNRMIVFGGRSPENIHFDDLHIFDTDTCEWLQPSVSGNKPIHRGVHTATLVGNYFILYGGSCNFDDETVYYHGDMYLIDKDQLLCGKSEGKDPSDVPSVASQDMTTANILECETIEEEEDETCEYIESSDEEK